MKTKKLTYVPVQGNAHNMGCGQPIRHALSGVLYLLHYKMRNGWMTQQGYHISDQSLSEEPWEIACDRGTLVNAAA